MKKEEDFMALDEFVRTSCSEEGINISVFKHDPKDSQFGYEELIFLSMWESTYYRCEDYYHTWWVKLKNIWSVIRTGHEKDHRQSIMLGTDEAKQLVEVLNRAIIAAKPKNDKLESRTVILPTPVIVRFGTSGIEGDLQYTYVPNSGIDVTGNGIIAGVKQ